MKINLVMIMKNEERSLERCLKQAGEIVDEIVIADTGSTDHSVEIAEKLGAKVWKYEWNMEIAGSAAFFARISGRKREGWRAVWPASQDSFQRGSAISA